MPTNARFSRRASTLPVHDLLEISAAHFAAVLYKNYERCEDGTFRAPLLGKPEVWFKLRRGTSLRVVRIISARASSDPSMWNVTVRDRSSKRTFTLLRDAPESGLLALGTHLRSLVS